MTYDSLHDCKASICHAVSHARTCKAMHNPCQASCMQGAQVNTFFAIDAGSCSLYGICLAAVTTTANTAPTITLLTTAAAPVTTSIKLGYDYASCASGQQPATGAECELGATALDAEDGNLTAAVLVCAPSVCTTPLCVSSKASWHFADE